MKRSLFRNLWIIFIIAMIGTGYFIFRKAEHQKEILGRVQSRLEQQRRELRNIRNLSASLAELDSLTIDEKTATQLEVLRHLDLEQGKYDFNLRGKQTKKAGGTDVYLRDFILKYTAPYPEALAFVDAFHNNKKVVLTDFKMRQGSGYEYSTEIEFQGRLYGLEKN